jgi:hypothetical protein
MELTSFLVSKTFKIKFKISAHNSYIQCAEKGVVGELDLGMGLSCGDPFQITEDKKLQMQDMTNMMASSLEKENQPVKKVSHSKSSETFNNNNNNNNTNHYKKEEKTPMQINHSIQNSENTPPPPPGLHDSYKRADSIKDQIYSVFFLFFFL